MQTTMSCTLSTAPHRAMLLGTGSGWNAVAAHDAPAVTVDPIENGAGTTGRYSSPHRSGTPAVQGPMLANANATAPAGAPVSRNPNAGLPRAGSAKPSSRMPGQIAHGAVRHDAPM